MQAIQRSNMHFCLWDNYQLCLLISHHDLNHVAVGLCHVRILFHKLKSELTSRLNAPAL